MRHRHCPCSRVHIQYVFNTSLTRLLTFFWQSPSLYQCSSFSLFSLSRSPQPSSSPMLFPVWSCSPAPTVALESASGLPRLGITSSFPDTPASLEHRTVGTIQGIKSTFTMATCRPPSSQTNSRKTTCRRQQINSLALQTQNRHLRTIRRTTHKAYKGSSFLFLRS